MQYLGMGKYIRWYLVEAEGSVRTASSVNRIPEHVFGFRHNDGHSRKPMRVNLDARAVNIILRGGLEEALTQRIVANSGNERHR